MKVIIAGSRGFTSHVALRQSLRKYKQDVSEVVCGMARGADLLGRQWALDNGIPVKEFPAKWNKFGKSAGYIRNAEMADYGDALIAFWDGESRGTKMMIDLAKKKNLRVEVVYI